MNKIHVRFGKDLTSTQTPIGSAMICECANFERYTPDGKKINNFNYEGDWDAEITSEKAELVANWILRLYPDSWIDKKEAE